MNHACPFCRCLFPTAGPQEFTRQVTKETTWVGIADNHLRMVREIADLRTKLARRTA